MIKNRSLTERKIIRAVGETIRSHGYTGLGVNKIARVAGVNKNLIYRYFGTVDELVETYILQKDYWLADNEEFKQAVSPEAPIEEMVNSIVSLLQRQFTYFYDEPEMQHLILSEISHDNELLKKLSILRENMAEPFFDATAEHFEKTDVNFRGVTALLSAGIYYLVLQSQKNDATNCGLNIRDVKDREIIHTTIRQITEWAFHSNKEDRTG